MSYDSFEVPDAIEPMVGYRGWVYENGHLYSCYRKVEWPIDRPLTSDCISPSWRVSNDPYRGHKVGRHYEPVKECSCGIYGLHEYPRVFDVKPDGNRRKSMKPWPSYAITGVIQGWGHMVVGTKGFRAEYAKPVALVARPRSQKWGPVVRELAEIYRIDIVDANELRQGGWGI